ncbi:MAG: hypothetical protein HYV60_22020 [Planctomycetia bacterium]|nr:hypothetical protein [Planctomycetia bacterium]
MNSDKAGRRWQFSLRSFLFTILIVGPVAGVVGPIMVESLTAWKPPPRQMPTGVTPRPMAPSAESDSYYETGETPLH